MMPNINTSSKNFHALSRDRKAKYHLVLQGTPYSKFVDQHRFKSAIPLLKDDSNKLVDVVYDLGYSDPAHFYRAFKRWAGVSPREYRRQLAV